MHFVQNEQRKWDLKMYYRKWNLTMDNLCFITKLVEHILLKGNFLLNMARRLFHMHEWKNREKNVRIQRKNKTNIRLAAKYTS